GECGGVAVRRANERREGLLVVGGVDDLVVEAASTHDGAGPEGRPGTQNPAAAGKPEGCCGNRHARGDDRATSWLDRPFTDAGHDVQGGGVVALAGPSGNRAWAALRRSPGRTV